MPTPEQTRVAIETAQRLDAVPYRERGAIAAEAAGQLGVSVQTLHGWMRPHRANQRKRRADFVPRETEDAELALSRHEADIIAAAIAEARRANNKQMMTLRKAVPALRRDGHILAAHIDRETGEIGAELSEAAIARAMRRYGVHPNQTGRPTAHQPKRTLHPNHEWQVDASVCVVYYLPGGGTEICEVDPAVHYKNKPHNVAAIEQFRVIRYVCTDHTSGVARWRYYPHSESGAATVAFLAWCMAPKPDRTRDPFHGAPVQVLVDPGATASGTVRRFCERLGVELIVTKRKNPRAKGQVEGANNIIELEFESGLRFQRQRINDFADLNRLADVFQLHWNATAKHSRHGMTRFEAWTRITPAQLRVTEDEATLRRLATEAPKTPTVTGDLTVAYKRGDITHWDVRTVPGASVGDKIQVLWSPLVEAAHGTGTGCAMAVTVDAGTGCETFHRLRPILRDDWGFRADAPVSGEEHKRMPETPAGRTAKRLSRLATGTTTERDDELARRRKDYRPLAGLDNGRGFDPYREAVEATPQQWLPRAGTEHRTAEPRPAAALLDHIAAAERLARAVRAKGGTWGPEQYQWLATRHPAGVPEDQLAALVAELTTEPGGTGATAEPDASPRRHLRAV
jgi:transposase-like protein